MKFNLMLIRILKFQFDIIPYQLCATKCICIVMISNHSIEVNHFFVAKSKSGSNARFFYTRMAAY